jgi:hypothetical protein
MALGLTLLFLAVGMPMGVIRRLRGKHPLSPAGGGRRAADRGARIAVAAWEERGAVPRLSRQVRA